MFRKILLSYFPEDDKSWLSPISFHLKLISPKLFYGISTAQSLENRRTIQLDTRFLYFMSPHIKLITLPNNNLYWDEIFFYSYKIFADLNWYDNYNINVILPVVMIVALKVYWMYIDLNNISWYLNPLLYSINYVLIFFFSRIKEYPSEDKNENLKFMLKLIEEIIFYLEYTKSLKKDYDKSKETTETIMNIIKSEPDFLMFLYNITEKISKVYANKSYTDITLLEYLSSGSLMDFPNEDEFKWIIQATCKKIFIKRFSLYLDADIITIANVIWWNIAHIWHLVNKQNEEFLPYFVSSLTYLDNLNFNDSIAKIVNQVLNFKTWGQSYIEQLREFNSDYVDIAIEPWMWFKQIQELLSKEMIENIKKVSSINEQFLDYYILLISKRLTNHWDNFQREILYENYTLNYIKDINISDLFIKNWMFDKITKSYTYLDREYFVNSYFFRTKKIIKKPKNFYFFTSSVLPCQIIIQAKKIILSEFNKKSYIEYISTPLYFRLLKKYFKTNIKRLIYQDNIRTLYLNKYFDNIFDGIHITEEQLKNFKKNVYFPDFIVFYEYLKFIKSKYKYEDLIFVSRLKESLFGFLIYRSVVKKTNDIVLNDYKQWVSFYLDKDLKLEEFYIYFEKKYWDFLSIFSNVKQNKKFINAFMSLYINSIPVDEKKFFVYDNFKDISYYNKRLFKI